MIFWQKLEGEGVTTYIFKNRSTLFCMMYYSIWPNQGTLCLSVCTPDPQKVIWTIENVSLKALNFMIFVKNSMGGREVNTTNTLSKINLSEIGWEGGGSTSIWIMSLNILGFYTSGEIKLYHCWRWRRAWQEQNYTDIDIVLSSFIMLFYNSDVNIPFLYSLSLLCVGL